MKRRHPLVLFVLISLLAVAGWAPRVAVAADVLLRSGGVRWGVATHWPDTWGYVASTLINPNDRPVNVTLVTVFDEQPQVQFATEVWLPAFSRRIVAQPLRVPQMDARNTSIALTTSLLMDSGFGVMEVTQEPSLLTLQHDGAAVILLSRTQSPALEVMARLERLNPASLQVRRASRNIFRNIPLDQLPLHANGWDSANCVVIAEPMPTMEPMQIEALRRWLMGGGKVWIMLDQVEPSFCHFLLGEDFTLEVVDRVPLTEVSIHRAAFMASDSPLANVAEPPRRFEDPVTMVRVVAPGFEVLHRVNGWPATLHRRVGLGDLIITTVMPPAWVEGGNPLPPLDDIAEILLAEPARQIWSAHQLQPLVEKPPELQLVHRDAAQRILSVFVLLLLGSGILLAKRDRLEQMAPISVILTFIAAAALSWTGGVQLGQRAASVAGIVVAQVDPVHQYARITGTLSFHSPAASDLPVRSRAGGWFLPEIAEHDLRTRRMTWTDSGQWSWQMPRLLPRVVQTARLQQLLPLDKPVHAALYFEPEGLRIRHQAGDFSHFSDPMLMGPGGDAMPDAVSRDACFIPHSSAATQAIAPRSTLSSDHRARRRMIVRALREQLSPLRPMLLATATRIDAGIEYLPSARHGEVRLVLVPLELVRPEPGTPVRVPPALIGSGWVASPGSEAPAARRVKFQLPVELLPLDIRAMQLQLSLDLSATGTVTVLAADGARLDSAQPEHGACTLSWDWPSDIDTGNGEIELMIQHGPPVTMVPEDTVYAIALTVDAMVEPLPTEPLNSAPQAMSPSGARYE